MRGDNLARIEIGAIDDDRMLLEATTSWLSDVPDIRLTTRAATVGEYLRVERGERVVLLDLRLADSSRPADNVERLVRHGCRVLVVSVHADRDGVFETISAGASGYLTKDQGLRELARTIREIAAGTHVLGQELAAAISDDRRPERPRLSDQELLTVQIYASGLTIKAVALEIHVTPATAKGYLQRVKDKYQAVGRPFGTRTELQRRLREDGIDPDLAP